MPAMPQTSPLATLCALACAAVMLGLLMLAAGAWCLMLATLLTLVAIPRHLRQMARARP